jgi:hypothetical protein
MSDQNTPRKGKKIVIPGPNTAGLPTFTPGTTPPGTAPMPAQEQRRVLDEIAKVQQNQTATGLISPQGQQFDFTKVHLHIGIPCYGGMISRANNDQFLALYSASTASGPELEFGHNG